MGGGQGALRVTDGNTDTGKDWASVSLTDGFGCSLSEW